jgi:hypothetical protein
MGSMRPKIDEKLRGAERLRVDAAARLKPNDWSSIEVRIVDLSRTGFRAESDARVQVGGCVSIEVPGVGAVQAQVEWQREGCFGARFVEPVDLAACGWTPKRRAPVLAELLVQRAAAHKAGREAAEKRIRRRILDALPMRAGAGPAA